MPACAVAYALTRADAYAPAHEHFEHLIAQLHSPEVHQMTHSELGRVDELFDDDPCGHEMNQSQKSLAQFLIPRRNTAKLFEVIEEPFHLLA